MFLAACRGREASSGSTPTPTPSPVKAAAAELPPAAPPPPLSRADTWLCRLEEWEDCKERCEAGNALSCARLAQLYQFGGSRYRYAQETFEKDAAAAAVAQERACKLGYPPACARLGVSLVDDEGPKDDVRGRALLREACAGRSAWACGWLASLDGEDREALLRRACELGDRDACLDVAVIDGDERGDDRAALRGMTRALKGAHAPSPLAAAVVTCTGDTFAVAEENDLVLTGPARMETFCARADGDRDGPYVTWYSEEDLWEGREHGVVLDEGTYRADQRHGRAVQHDDEGRLIAEGAYVDGQRDGTWIEWDESASPVEREEGTYRAGKRDGTFTEYRGDDVVRTQVYVAGKMHGLRVQRESDGGRCEVEYVEGRQQGLDRCWNARGKLIRESTWVDGHLEGLHRAWHANGKLEETGMYRDHEKTGVWTYYHANGKRSREGEHDGYDEVGTWKAWDERGRPQEP